jgi:hypothetical protein
MSNVDINTDNTFMISHVGGNVNSDTDINIDDDFKYTNKQKKIIDGKKKLIHTHIDTDTDTDSNIENVRVMNYEHNGPATKEIKIRNIKKRDNVKKKNDNKYDNKYDLYQDYQYKKGVYKGESVVRYNTYNININSACRRKEPIVKIDKELRLCENPLKFEENRLVIDVGAEHGLTVGDKINIYGLKYVKKTIRTFTTYVVHNDNGTTSEVKNYAVDIIRSTDSDNNSPIFMRFDVDFNIDVDTINLLPSTGIDKHNLFYFDDMSNNLKYKEYDLSYNDLYVDISGFKTNDGSTKIGNIPINSLNGRHKIYFAPRLGTKNSSPDSLGTKILGLTDPILNHNNISNQKSFYIKLHKPFEGNLSGISAFNVNITFEYYGGIPVNNINAEYPANIYHLHGFHEIKNVYSTKIEINMDRNAYFSGKFGGNGMYLSRIKDVMAGFYNSNMYTIDLPRTFNNIIRAQLLSTEFPNYDTVFKDANSSGKANNKLYWQNLDDGSHVYFIEIPTGRYSSVELQERLEKLFYNTLKVNQSSSNNVFTKNNIIKVNIDTNTNIVQFSSFKESIINKPITKIDPSITSSNGSGISAVSEVMYTLTINHNNHGLNVGDQIVISGMLTTLGIPAEKLNAEFNIKSIVNESAYTIEIKYVNLENIRIDTFGGNGVKIYSPNFFRMRFDYDDTMGKQLGFRDPGLKSSITRYTTIVSNNTVYENEINFDSSGNRIFLKRNALQLHGENYVLMACEELNGIINIGPVNPVFAKINLTGCHGSIAHNTFVPVINYYHTPIRKLNKLSISFHSANGELFDFDGLDHSFTIELVTLDETPDGTEISAGIGKIYQ